MILKPEQEIIEPNSRNNNCLSNPRHEKFALALALGKSRTEAYKAAGYNGDRSAAHRLSTNVNILARVKDLQTLAANRTGITLDAIIAELEETRQMSMALGQCHAAAYASIGKAKLLGIGVTKG